MNKELNNQSGVKESSAVKERNMGKDSKELMDEVNEIFNRLTDAINEIFTAEALKKFIQAAQDHLEKVKEGRNTSIEIDRMTAWLEIASALGEYRKYNDYGK